MGALEGKVAIVTGGGQGCGRGMATAYAKEGAAVTITGRTKETLEKTKEDLLKIPGARVLALVADGTDDEAVKEAVRRTVDEFGRIDILVNNAQSFRYGIPLDQTTLDDFRVVLDSWLFAAFRYIVACFPYLKETQGTIINIVSDAGISGFVGYAAYAANKEAMRGLTRVVARELGPFGITANAMVVAMLTEHAKVWLEQNPDAAKEATKSIPLGRIGDPEIDAGGVAVFLATLGGHYLTGETLNVNGGLYMRP